MTHKEKYYIYIMTNKVNTVFYVGVTNNLLRRIYKKKKKYIQGFTEKYNIIKLVYYEVFDDISFAILREKQLKRWHREWKVNLIKSQNPEMRDLYEELLS